MWHIIATVCFLGLSTIERACFPDAYFPEPYPTQEICLQVANDMVDILHDDFERINVYAVFDCTNQRPLTLPPQWPEPTDSAQLTKI